MKYIKLFESFDRNLIEEQLKKYDIKGYTINEDGTIDVDGTIYLQQFSLHKIPFKFGQVSGNFFCYDNYLESLEGCPYYVGGAFSCTQNKLTNLIGGPEEVGSTYKCSANNLTSLEGVAAEIGGYFDCSNNKLTDLNISSIIKSDLYCNANRIDPNNYQFYGEVGGKIYFMF